MLELEVIQGSAPDWVVTAISRSDGSLPTGFLSSDVLSAQVWVGQNQSVLFAPAVSWSDYTTGAVNVSLTNAQSAALDFAGRYYVIITATRGSKSVDIIECTLRVMAAPGTSTEVVTPYCSYVDILDHAPWITMIQDDDSGQESYYTQRLRAKEWLDWLIIRNYRGTSASYFGDPGRGAQYWMGGWARRSALPSQWLINQLSGGIVIQPVTLTAQGHGYTFATVTFSGGGTTTAGQATGFATVSGGQVVGVSLIQAGYGYTSTPTITITGDGTGATATCSVSLNVLIVRPEIARVCALKAASIVGLGQIGKQNNIAAFGAMWRDMASAAAPNIVAELDLNGDGLADLAITLQSTNTLNT